LITDMTGTDIWQVAMHVYAKSSGCAVSNMDVVSVTAWYLVRQVEPVVSARTVTVDYWTVADCA